MQPACYKVCLAKPHRAFRSRWRPIVAPVDLPPVAVIGIASHCMGLVDPDCAQGSLPLAKVVVEGRLLSAWAIVYTMVSDLRVPR